MEFIQLHVYHIRLRTSILVYNIDRAAYIKYSTFYTPNNIYDVSLNSDDVLLRTINFSKVTEKTNYL